MNRGLIRSGAYVLLIHLTAASVSHAAPPGSESASRVPGVVIDHVPAASGTYVGSPSIAILPTGEYIASHDLFGPQSNEHKSATTRIFRSRDRGESWSHVADIDGAFWSTLF